MKSIFQNLPNNLIMNIIKMAEDQRKQDEEKLKFNKVINNLNQLEKGMLEFYSKEQRDMYDDGVIKDLLGDIFDEVYEENQRKLYEEDMEMQRQEELRWDPEYMYERRNCDEPCEWDYDWGEEYEPSWA